MIKGILIGVLLVVVLVGYGVLDTSTIAGAGEQVKNVVDHGISLINDALGREDIAYNNF
jgi:hypothetical protein